MGQLTISTGPFSSSQPVGLPGRLLAMAFFFGPKRWNWVNKKSPGWLVWRLILSTSSWRENGVFLMANMCQQMNDLPMIKQWFSTTYQDSQNDLPWYTLYFPRIFWSHHQRWATICGQLRTSWWQDGDYNELTTSEPEIIVRLREIIPFYGRTIQVSELL